MKRHIIPFLAIPLLLGCALFESPDEDFRDPNMASSKSGLKKIPKIKKRILVVKIINKSLFGGKDLAEHATTRIRNEILSLNDYVLVAEAEIPEQSDFISEFQTFNLDKILENSRAYGVSGVILGTIEDLTSRESGDEVGIFRTKYRMSKAKVKLQLYDVGSERLILSSTGDGDVKEEFTEFLHRKPAAGFDTHRGKVAVEKAFDEALKSLPGQLTKIDWSGKIVKVDLPRFYINAGKSTGVRMGQFLKVFAPDKAIFESDTGTLMGLASGRFKGTIEVIDYFGKDGAVAIAHSGESFKEGDRVEVHLRKKP